MLEKLLKLEGVGLFANPLPKAVEFKRATLIYADNGRGKSTLSAVMRACAAADSQAMAARATIGGTSAPRAQLRFKLPTGGTNITFDAGAWDASMPSLMVFDQTFIERNVFAGGEVHADHHQSLLDFALGTAAVTKKKEVDDASEAMTVATKARSAAEGIDAYVTFFNEQYNAHNGRIQALTGIARRSLSDGTVDSWAGEFQANSDRAQAWVQQLPLD